ncbi:hypothetical protein A3F27_00540 [Candidatus Kaiserbacteria bacterium RIFCSPHIGHO2_12_FULL_53_13]|uniref:Uncharacterized protein n=1 Tax=Candidatus Kaiserbacteria bacterium RIFCSPHIGHO2_12_FULL_53_13 TaxID=1798502 RepID=A0A1F6E8U2_9BACT|nr:MAG: hypothetical protein A3F27_00540 [Candidatus Kaiserbacteria bacterium RIFCSPHIGHO2_12_FULL_53_13]OGG74448.1 MAG: hypothetical protein A3A37_02245 [Candidatus Kaiserbacteria bacterium RIFCSPLOWO2_01_FULL_52_36]
MYRDGSKPDEVQIKDVFKQSWLDFRNAFLEYRNSFAVIGLLLAATGLFLGIHTNDEFLKRIQAFLLLVTIISILIVLLGSLKVFLKGKHPELYHASALIFLWIGGLFVFNLLAYFFSNFEAEILFYLKWLGTPVIAVGVNLLAIYTFRLVRKYRNVDGWQLEMFFFYTLNIYLVNKYFFNGLDILKTLRSIFSFDVFNLYIPYIFLISIFSEIRSFGGRALLSMWVETAILMAAIILPLVLYWGLPLFIH